MSPASPQDEVQACGTGAMDLLIAATAHAHGAALVTRNAKDLKGIEHLVDIATV